MSIDDPFHSCAFLAFVEEARAVQGWPDSERVRQNAYRRYEALIRKRDDNHQKRDHHTKPPTD